MTFFEDKVVPFERPASYWQKKARKAYKPDRLPEAARLMRKALEQGGDSHTALELAAIYRSMLCISAAERYLMKAAAEGGITPQLCRCDQGRADAHSLGSGRTDLRRG